MLHYEMIFKFLFDYFTTTAEKEGWKVNISKEN